jgi:hypothetical protein
MKTPTTAQKYLALATVLPTIADFIEDLKDTNVFKHSLAQKANLLLNEIRRADNKFFEGLDEETKKRLADQQHNAGMSFRQWVAEEIKDPFQK